MNRSRHCLPGDELGPSQPVAGVIGAAFSGVSIMVANILKLFKVGTFTSNQESSKLNWLVIADNDLC